MPELVEVEQYRRLAARVVGRRVSDAEVVDAHVTRGAVPPTELARALVGRRVAHVRRHGKLLVLDMAGGPSLGIRFGMTGTLVVDGTAGVDRLLYSPAARAARWVRFRLAFAAGGELVLHDPRRLGRVELDPDEGRLGPDAAELTMEQLVAALGSRRRDPGRSPGVAPSAGRGSAGPPLKSRLMDQSRVAGIGNLLADEILWRAGLSPARPAGSLTPAEARRLHRHLHATVEELIARGGSHTGDLMPERRAGGRCPRDGHELVRAKVGGRTSWWCPVHQV